MRRRNRCRAVCEEPASVRHSLCLRPVRRQAKHRLVWKLRDAEHLRSQWPLCLQAGDERSAVLQGRKTVWRVDVHGQVRCDPQHRRVRGVHGKQDLQRPGDLQLRAGIGCRVLHQEWAGLRIAERTRQLRSVSHGGELWNVREPEHLQRWSLQLSGDERRVLSAPRRELRRPRRHGHLWQSEERVVVRNVHVPEHLWRGRDGERVRLHSANGRAVLRAKAEGLRSVDRYGQLWSQPRLELRHVFLSAFLRR